VTLSPGLPLTTVEAVASLYDGAVGGIYGAKLSAWVGEANHCYEKVVLGITKATPALVAKQTGIPLGNSTGLGGAATPTDSQKQ
jgi:filamentous hemagglutinin